MMNIKQLYRDSDAGGFVAAASDEFGVVVRDEIDLVV